MKSSPSDLLRRRLTLPRFLFRQAQRALQKAEAPHSWGLAASLLQDSVEVLLRLIAESHRLSVSDRTQFAELLRTVETRFPSVGGHRAGLTTLNTTRVAFKHRGQELAENDARVFIANVEAFLTQVYDEVFGVDFASMSLADAIGHRRTQNWLAEAECAFAGERYAESVEHAAKAMTVYMAHSIRNDVTIRLRSIVDYRGSRDQRDFQSWVEETIPSLQARLDLFTRGVDIASFDRFTMLTPWTRLNYCGAILQSSRASAPKPSREDARFCINFVVESALALRARRVLRPPGETEEPDRVRVKSRCEVIASPPTRLPYELHRTDELEIIRVADRGEELTLARGFRVSRDPEFLGVIQDGDIAYVRKDCLETDLRP